MPAKKTKKPAKTPSAAAKNSAQPKPKAAPKAELAAVADAEWRQSGLCAQSQADGVPCSELGRRCEECEKAEAKFAR